ncbi:hypothetical protein SAY87_030548 [Trapa incisa]|uniref:Protein TIFY n=1 Tax=Trapa incisa TaxID=236973 RepID=A0AAN7KVE6_9MYRT|nr:hypothetical protein SAY87_030548 [Trapa incisa]
MGERQNQAKPSTAANAPLSPHHQGKAAMFHDFLGVKTAGDCSPDPALASPVAFVKTDDARPSDASPAVSAGASSGGGRGGPISTTSDLGSERQVSTHFEGVPFYGPRSDISGPPDINNRLMRSKRSNLDSAFMGSARDGVAQGGLESHENLHLLKMLGNGLGGERRRRFGNDEASISVHPSRQTSTSFVLHPGVNSRNDPGGLKWDYSIPTSLGPNIQFPTRGAQFSSPFAHHMQPNRLREIHASTPTISHSAADEGSRTGMKGPGILSSIHGAGTGSEKNLPVGPQSSEKAKPSTINTDPESSNPSSRHGMASVSRQMTIFYGGQAHVFDDVHPNKADIIMALAGSNGGSWSTTFSPKSGSRLISEGNLVIGENEIVSAASVARDLRGKFPAIGNSGHGAESADRISNPIGGILGGSSVKGMRNMSLPADEKKGV